MGSRPKYTCPHCNIKKHLKTNYDEHISWCEIIHTPRTGEHDIMSFDKIPSITELFVLIKHVVKENAELKRDVAKLKAVQYRNHRKYFDDWLQLPQNKCKITVDEWFQDVSITTEHLYIIFEHDFITGFKTCLMNAIDECVDFPIKCFIQKPNTFYMFTTKWTVMRHSEFTKYIRNLSHRIFQKYIEWEESYDEKIKTDVELREKLFSYAKKFNDPFSSNRSINIIHKWWFSQLCKNVPNIIEYDFST